jgi:SAM-dependent methyltransferase
MSALDELMSNEVSAKAVLEGSHYHSTYSDWRAARSFIARAIDGDGSILDVGCANGLLLACLQKWSNFSLVPFGIDIDEERLQQARELFPAPAAHFANMPVESLHQLSAACLPNAYRYVYWNIWDGWHFDKADQRQALKSAASIVLPGGRLILGFYDRDPVHIPQKIIRIAELLRQPPQKIENHPRREMLIWFNSTR